MKLVKTSLLLYIQFLNIDPFTWILHTGVGLGDMEKNRVMLIFFHISRYCYISWYNLNNQKITFLHICVYVQCFSDVQTLKTDFYLLVQSSCATALYLLRFIQTTTVRMCIQCNIVIHKHILLLLWGALRHWSTSDSAPLMFSNHSHLELIFIKTCWIHIYVPG